MLVNGQATLFLLKFIRFRFAGAEMSSAPVVIELTSPSLCLVLGASWCRWCWCLVLGVLGGDAWC